MLKSILPSHLSLPTCHSTTDDLLCAGRRTLTSCLDPKSPLSSFKLQEREAFRSKTTENGNHWTKSVSEPSFPNYFFASLIRKKIYKIGKNYYFADDNCAGGSWPAPTQRRINFIQSRNDNNEMLPSIRSYFAANLCLCPTKQSLDWNGTFIHFVWLLIAQSYLSGQFGHFEKLPREVDRGVSPPLDFKWV